MRGWCGFVGVIIVVAFSGCGMAAINDGIKQYHRASVNVSLGDSKEKVLSVLLVTQEGLPAAQRRPPESFRKDGVQTDIYYFRTGPWAGNQVTDDMFTPYVFVDGKLTSIGWTALGGPKTVYRPPSHQETVINTPSSPTTTTCQQGLAGSVNCYSY
jgi:hypothetical protein